MIDPICAVCGETRIGELLMYNYGVCLCVRCNKIAAHAFIKAHAEKKLKDAGKAGRDRIAAARLQEFGDGAKVSEAAIKYKLKEAEAEEATQIYVADLAIENNRLRTKLADLEKEHSDFLNRCFWLYWLFWILLGAGVVAGMFLAYFLFN